MKDDAGSIPEPGFKELRNLFNKLRLLFTFVSLANKFNYILERNNLGHTKVDLVRLDKIYYLHPNISVASPFIGVFQLG